eukprot:CAMPEP_0116122774 /NCGR_PEP_ID=MMETSP0329-20121206/4393_1 /TAXON_ID=697910 /ORGANISM="Pseudo-nitzschia arenysensis, Strain B593" /LENGTH=222 /DNA_ID=CAMNT_0003616643 /DNA_START=117 /DNA_END=785 /DNA_ORIENTATION=+
MSSRTMKPEEAIQALAFLSNAEELTMSYEASLPVEVRDNGFGKGVRGRLAKLLSEKSLDLYSMKDPGQGNNSNNNPNNNNQDASSKKGTCSTTTPDSDEKGVSFGVVEVRKYPITIGMNPSVSRGVPRTIEWDHLEDETELHHINAYERDRPNEERKRGEELLLDGLTRAKMLQNVGYTKTELLEGIRRTKEAKQIYQKGRENGNRRRRDHDSLSLYSGSKR